MPAKQFDRRRPDRQVVGELELRAHLLLEQHPHFRGRAELFHYECQDKLLTVRGVVPTFYLKQLIQVVLMQLDDGIQIDNQVTVTAYTSIRDANPEE